eukprot:SAG31_NODE_1486_length_8148_cov_6.234439_2_plen_298_part_00
MATAPGPDPLGPCLLWQDLPAHNGAATFVLGNACGAAGDTSPCLACSPAATAGGGPCEWAWLGKAESFDECHTLATAVTALPGRGATVCQTLTWCHPEPPPPGTFDRACYCGLGVTWNAPHLPQANTDAAICLKFGGAWGTPFLVALMLALGVYLGGGVAFRVRTAGAAPSLRSHPHFSLWQEIRSLCEDGLAFARSCGNTKPRPAGGGSSMRAPLREDNARGEGWRSSPKRDGGGGKQSKKERREKENRRDRKQTEGEGDAAAPAAVVVVAVPVPRAAPAAGTSAGDGGRWVHVPG